MGKVILKLKGTGHIYIDTQDILFIHDSVIGTELRVKNSTSSFMLEESTLDIWNS